MKINFDQLFGKTAPQPSSNYKKINHLSQASTSFGLEQFERANKLTKSPAKKQQISTVQYFKLSNKKKDETMRILQNNKQPNQNYLWYIETKLDENANKIPTNPKQFLNQNKSLKKQQMKQLTQRLSQKHICNKKTCQDICNYQKNRRIKQQSLPFDTKIKKFNRTLTQTCQFEKIHPSKLHERLYNEYKQKQFNNLQLSLQYEERQQQNYKLKLYKNDRYTQNYVPFYQRLDYEIEKKNKKQEFYAKNIIYNDQILQFSPNIQVSQSSFYSKNKKFIKPKRQKNQIKGYGQMKALQRLSRSLDNSIENMLNRSMQIVHSKQEKFIQRMISLFEQDGYFIMKPQAIQQLDQIQFQKFFPLLSQMQNEQNLQIKVFQQKLRKYFEKLPKNDKLALRKHDVEKKKQTRTLKKQMQVQTARLPQTLHQNTKNNKKIQKDYLLKMQQFV